MSARFALKSATADAHARLDDLMSRFDLTGRRGYGDFLLAQAGAFLGVERGLDAAGAGALIPDWRERRRSDHLQADLAELGLRPPEAAAPIAFPSDPAVLGAAYVLEGSRLGGAVLRRMIPADMPCAFLTTRNAAAWTVFVQMLDERLSSAEGVAIAGETANRVFGLFEASALNFIGAASA